LGEGFFVGAAHESEMNRLKTATWNGNTFIESGTGID